jgi:endonuclease/exonuclease/phosphatase (EEP) superfamily protein YafD
MALVSDVSVAGRTLVAYNLHLESRGDDSLRCSQLDECFDDARRHNSGTPIILAGDLNLDVSRSAAAGAIRKAQFQSAFPKPPLRTTPPRSLFDRGRVIDWVFTRGPVKALHPQVQSSVSASDHYPLSVTLILT